jgi:hypothetical protein
MGADAAGQSTWARINATSRQITTLPDPITSVKQHHPEAA